MAVNPEDFYTGNGTKTDYSINFEYIDEADVKVSLNDVVQATTEYSFANATTILFNTAPGNNVAIRIYRDTNVDNLKATFFAGSSIRAQDLNQNFEQNNYAVQEIKAYTWDNETNTIHSDETWVSSDDQIATTAAMDARFQDEAAETILSTETWISDDDHIATTAALDQRFQDEISETITSTETWPSNNDTIPTTLAADNRSTFLIDNAIDLALTTDIGTDGTGVTVTNDGDGTITLGIGASSVDLDRIKADDIITYTEQPNVAPTDNNIFTASAAQRQFDTIVQVANPGSGPWEVGKTWLQNDVDKTLSIWDGGAWVPVASGGAFTELTKVIYVDSINGNDALAGHRISNPKRTIKAAIDDINADPDGDGSLVVVAPGVYGEEFPIAIQKNDVAIVGTSLRNCIIHPAVGVIAATSAVDATQYRIRFVGTTDFTAIGAPNNNVGTVFTADLTGGATTGTGTLEDIAVQTAYDVDTPEANELATMFQVNSGSYFAGLTLQGMKASGTRGGNSLDTDATYGLPTNQGWNFAFYPNAVIKKSPYIQNCTNFSDSQINNVTFTPHTPGEGAAGDLDSAPSGGGILIDGAVPASSSPLRSMVCDSYTHTALNGPGIFVTNNGYCQATSSYSFFNHYHLKTKNGGQANLAASTTDFGSYSLIADGRSTSAIFTANTTVTANAADTSFTIDAPTAGGSWHGNATRPQDNMLVDIGGNTYPVVSAVAAGSGWTVTISNPNPLNYSSNLGLPAQVTSGSPVSFYLRSMIASSGHTMEYVGSGTDYTALPENGGVPNDTRQITELNNGKVWAAITDHRGTFRVGDSFSVNQSTGEVFIAGAAANIILSTGTTGSAILPAGTTAERDVSPVNGYLRYNSNTGGFEGYANNTWTPLGGLTSVVNDATPQLGGALDTNGNNIDFGDDVRARFGAAADLQIYHNGNNSFVKDNGTGDLFLAGDNAVRITSADFTESKAVFDTNGSVRLFYDNVKKLETTSDGVDFDGTGSITVPQGTDAERPSTAVNGMFRYNTTSSAFEGYANGAWGDIGGGGGAAAGTTGSIQINDGAGAFSSVTNFIWDSANTELDVPGSINLDTGGAFTTTLQTVTATANRYISLPDQTGTVALLQGINGAVQFNDNGTTSAAALGCDATTKTFGYISHGGTVTQLTVKTNPVTLNRVTGEITTSASSLAADTSAEFTLTNNTITENDILIMNYKDNSGTTAGSAYVLNAVCSNGSVKIGIRNVDTVARAEAIKIQFAVIKSLLTN